MGCSGEFQVSLGDIHWKFLVQFVKVGRTLGEMNLSSILPLAFVVFPEASL